MGPFPNLSAPDTMVGPIPESVLKKRKTQEKLDAEAKKKAVDAKKKAEATKKEIFTRAEKYVADYLKEEANMIKCKRDAKKTGNIYVEPEAKLMFVIRIRGINALPPQPKKILQLLRLRQIHNGVFLKVNKATLGLLQRVQPYIAYGYPNLKTVKELIYKRGYGKDGRIRLPIGDNSVIEEHLGKYDIICMEDLIHEIYTVGPNFKYANKFLWPFKLSSPNKGGFKKIRNHFIEDGDAGNREAHINDLIRRMN